MKKIQQCTAALIAALTLFSACAAPTGTDQTEPPAIVAHSAAIPLPAAGKEPEGAEADALLADAVTSFTEQFMKKIGPSDANTVYSPLSLYYALALTANGASGETAEEFEAALGMSPEQADEYLYTLAGRLAESDETKVSVSSSVWGNAARFTLSPDFASVARKYFDADAESLPFDAAAVRKINGWVNEKTDGMIPSLFSTLDPESPLVLVNTVLFDGVWEEEYEDRDVRPGTFTLADGGTKEVSFLRSEEYTYFETAGGKGFSKDYKNGYRFIGVRPEGSVEDFVAGMDLSEIVARSKDSGLKADCAVPKFEYETEAALNGVTKELGIEKAFTGAAELGGLSASGENNIFIDSILQKAKIFLNEHGTKAAAATGIMFGTTAFMPEERREVILDKPFFYAIVNADGIPLFVGTVMNPENQ